MIIRRTRLSSSRSLTSSIRVRKRLTTRLLPTALAAGLAFTCLAPAVSADFASGAQAADNVVNGTFTKNTAGWRTNSTDQQLKHVAAGHTGAGAELSVTKGTSNVVLNDVKPTVAKADDGQSYTVTAWVKAKKAGIGGHLRVRAVGSEKTKTQQKYFYLSNTNWTKVSFSFKNSVPNAEFDLNVVGYDIPAGNALSVDDVTLAAGTEVTENKEPVAPAPSTAGGQLTNGGTYSKIGIPSKGAFFGAAVGSNSDPASFEKQTGGKLGLRRTYYSSSQVSKAVSTAKSDLANNRLPWISFKLPHSWSQMAAGKGDAWVKDLVKQLDALDGPVWVAFHHEPEGDAAIKDWVAMQKHLSPLVKKNSDNVAFTMILTGWHQIYGDSQYSLENTWPGDGLVDVVGYDVYNSHGIVKNGKPLKATDMDGSYFKHFEAFAKKHNTRWALAETGINDSAASQERTWMKDTYNQLVNRGGVGMAYFNTPLNSVTSWVITDSVKTKQFAEALKVSAKIK